MEKKKNKLTTRMCLLIATAAALIFTLAVPIAAETEAPVSDSVSVDTSSVDTDGASVTTSEFESVVAELDKTYETDANGDYVFESSSGGFRIQDILLVPMGFIIRICYAVTHNYAAALFLFALVMQLILFPLGIKQQKNMNKQASLRPKENAIRKKYAGRTDAVTQKKINDEIMALYQQENFNPASGCLPLLIQLPIIFALFAVVRQPLTYITRLSSGVIAALKAQVSALLGAGNMTVGYEEINVISYLKEHGTAALHGMGGAVSPETIEAMPSFKMFGGAFDLSVLPSSKIWSIYLLVPILTFIFMYGSMKLTRKFTYQSQAMQDQQSAASMKIMDLVSPVMCTYFAFVVPSAIGIYWMYRNILAFVQQFVLSKLYPTPKFTEEELKEAEREYMGKSKKPTSSGTKTERDPNKPKPRSLHRIDFDDDDDSDGGESAKPALSEPKEKGDSPIDSAPLKKDDK